MAPPRRRSNRQKEKKRLEEAVRREQEKIEVYRSVIKSLRRKLHKLRKELREQDRKSALLIGNQERLKEMLQKTSLQLAKIQAKIKSEASHYSIFVRPHPGGELNEADIIEPDGSELRKVLLLMGNKSVNDIKPGWQVILFAGNIAKVIESYYPLGVEVKFVEKLNDDLALIESSYSGAKLQCFLGKDLKNIKLQKGDSLLNCGGVLVKALPKTEEKEHFMDVEEISDFDWSKVGGLSRTVRQIQRILLPFKEAGAYRDKFKGRNLPKGMILHGPSGCGKTLAAKCIATDLARYRSLKCYFMELAGAELSNKFVGETSKKIRELFARAKEKAGKDALVLIFIDEMDSLFRSRSTSNMEHEPWQAEQIGQFNKILDGMDPLENILVIGASNHKHLIDAAILRPGRLGRDVFVPRPRTRKTITEILKIYLTPDLPFAKKYFEKNEYKYQDHFGSGKEEVAVLDKNPEKIRDHFIDVIIKRLLYKGEPVNVIFEDDGKEIIRVGNRFKALTESGEGDVWLKNRLSGAILESIVETAKEIALERYIRLKEAGEKPEPDIIKKDFFKAIDEEFQRLKHSSKQLKEKDIGFKPSS